MENECLMFEMDVQRKARQLLAEGKTQSYEKAELAMKLMDLKFDEEEAIYAANECTSLYTAISYLQQDCELCASKYGVKDVIQSMDLDHHFISFPFISFDSYRLAAKLDNQVAVID